MSFVVWKRRHRQRVRGSLVILLAPCSLGLGCTKSVDVVPSLETGETPGLPTHEPGSGPDKSQPDKSQPDKGSGKATPDASSKSSQDPSSEPSEGEESNSENSDPAESGTCDDLESHECVQEAPKGWSGPTRVNHAEKPRDLEECESATPGADVLYEDWSAQPAACFRCSGTVNLPPCGDVEFVGFTQVDESVIPTQCIRSSILVQAAIPYDTCISIDDQIANFGSRATHIGFRSPQALHKNVSCPAPSPEKRILPPEAQTYWRVCDLPKEELSCKAAGMKCLKKRTEAAEPACIFSTSKTECPASSIYSNKIETTSHFEDTRGCTDCTLELVPGNSPDDFTCHPSIDYFEREHGDCSPEGHSGNVNDSLEEVCLTRQELEIYEYRALFIERAYVRYSGHCRSRGWKPTGELKPKKWVTICCNF